MKRLAATMDDESERCEPGKMREQSRAHVGDTLMPVAANLRINGARAVSRCRPWFSH